MKRKVIQIAGSTQLVSLPRKWCQRFGVKKGDELEVEEEGNKVTVGTDKGMMLDHIDLNISGLDDSTILHYIQGAYKIGYDEISVKFSNTETMSFKLEKNIKTLKVVQNVVSRLIGMEIISQKEDSCLIKDISVTSATEFDNVLRRILLLVNDMSRELKTALEKKDFNLAETTIERHDTITKFVSFCLRLLNKRGYKDYKKTSFLFHIIASLDKITDVLKYLSRELSTKKINVSSETLNIFDDMCDSLQIYYEAYYKFDNNKLVELSKKRREVRKKVDKLKTKLPPEDIFLCGQVIGIFDLLLDITEARIAIEF